MSAGNSGMGLGSTNPVAMDPVGYVLQQLASESCELFECWQSEIRKSKLKDVKINELTQDFVRLDQRRVQEVEHLRGQLSMVLAKVADLEKSSALINEIRTLSTELSKKGALLEQQKSEHEDALKCGLDEIKQLKRQLSGSNVNVRALTELNSSLQEALAAELDNYAELEQLIEEKDRRIEKLQLQIKALAADRGVGVEKKSYLSALASPPPPPKVILQHPGGITLPSNAEMAIPFDVQVLLLCKTGNIEDCKVAPAPLRRCGVEGTAGAYLKQFLAYIKEDMRSQIASELGEIFVKPTRAPLAPVSSRVELVSSAEIAGTRSLVLHTPFQKFHKTDHGFNMEVICIRIPASRNGVKFVIGVASEVRDYDFEDDDDEQPDLAVKSKKNVEISVKLLSQYYPDVAAQSTVEWHWLCGLVPAQRMYTACLAKQVPFFFKWILGAHPTPFPAATNMAPEATQRLKTLNVQQQSVVARLCGRTESGLYCLVGPPGTGKTTTIVHLLHERVLQFPDERMLLTAPSNKAVQVVMLQLLRKFPSAPAVAFAGVPAVLPEEMEEFCAHKYASYLVTPLRAVNQQKGNFAKMVSALEGARAEILTRLNRLVARRGLAVDKTVSTPVLSLIDGLTRMFESMHGENAADVKSFVTSVRIYILYSAATLENYIIQKSQIVFCTLVTSGRKRLAQLIKGFDCVIVDEAAQALVPETFIPFKFNPRMYVLIGDPQQLPGMANSHQLRNLGYDASLMQIFTDVQSPYVEKLTTQYRMHPCICKWTSHQFYEGSLVTGGNPTARAKKANLQQLVSSTFVDCDFEEEKRAHGEITNVREAEVVIALTKHLLQQGVRPEQIGVITFYSAQVLVLKEMRAKLAKELPQIKNILTKLVISTVDGFQGDERDITLISCVRTIRSVGFLSDHRRINVALSRANMCAGSSAARGRWRRRTRCSRSYCAGSMSRSRMTPLRLRWSPMSRLCARRSATS